VVPAKTEIDVSHVARLARLNLTAEETELFQQQLARVLEYAEKLREPDTSGVDHTDEADVVFDVLREDEPRSWFTAEEALSNAPRQAGDLFVVPKVVE
jgi:aspartyl-tRNA(Asn)/glutamyl-tRNA(Gln) amidotransferase subunit C